MRLRPRSAQREAGIERIALGLQHFDEGRGKFSHGVPPRAARAEHVADRLFQRLGQLADRLVEQALVMAQVEVQPLPLAGHQDHRLLQPPGKADFQIDVGPLQRQVGDHELRVLRSPR